MRVLVVEDDDQLAQSIGRQLRGAGFVADRVGDAESALLWPDCGGLDAIVLDLALPDMSGLEFLKIWRARGLTTPVLVLSACSDWRDKVSCLNAGAEDYVVKPVHSEELVARLHALQRRVDLRPISDWITFGAIRVHPEMKLVEVDGQEVQLSAMEFRLLYHLLKKQGGAVTQEEALDALYPYDIERQANTIEAHVARLRRKIGRDHIVNTRGLGYKLVA